MTAPAFCTVLFSDTVDEQTAMMVRRIAGNHDRFATDFIGVVDPDGTVTVAIRLEARQVADGSWAIDRFTYVPSINSFKQESEARPGLCFFDALSHCARFQATELAGHNRRQIITVPRDRWADVASCRDAAAGAFQIIDDNGYAQPCAEGRILTDGLYSMEAMETAYKTKNINSNLPAVQTVTGMPRIVSELLAVNRSMIGPRDLVARYNQKMTENNEHREWVQKLEATSLAADKLRKGVSLLTERKFKTCPNSFVTYATLGIAPILLRKQGHEDYTVDGHLFMLKKQFQDSVWAIDHAPLQSLGREFAKNAESTFWLERALRILKDDREPGQHSDSAVTRAMECFNRAALVSEWNDMDTERVMAECFGQKFEPMTFVRELEKSWKIYNLNVQSFVHDIDPATPIGHLLPDGTIFGGVSPTTKTFMFFAPKDSEFLMNQHAAAYQPSIVKNFYGHDGNGANCEKEFWIDQGKNIFRKGWRLTTLPELYVLYKNKDAKGFKDELGQSGDHYWSYPFDFRSDYPFEADYHVFNIRNGESVKTQDTYDASVRYVRT
jgi:hypothetical protein